MIKHTPAMQQYMDIKVQYQDCILFFRMGDFYEVFGDDAILCHKILDIVLTTKNKQSENPVPMAGIPYHAKEKYMQKLMQHKYKVAIAEQVGDVIPGKIVERKVVNIVTPGTNFSEDDKEHTFILSIVHKSSLFHCAWGDISTATFFTKTLQDSEEIYNLIVQVQACEIILSFGDPINDTIIGAFQGYSCAISYANFHSDSLRYIQTTLDIHGVDIYGQALTQGREHSFALLLWYIQNTQSKKIHIHDIKHMHDAEHIQLDQMTIKNLELFRSSYDLIEKYSVYGVLQSCITPMGSRLFRSILQYPCRSLEEIQTRSDYIGYYYTQQDNRTTIQKTLSSIYDIVKLCQSYIYKNHTPALLLKCRASLVCISGDDRIFEEGLLHIGCPQETINDMKDLYQLLVDILVADEDIQDSTCCIRGSYSQKIKELQDIAFHSDQLLINYQQELVQYFGIPTLKVKYITNQGFFIELTPKEANKIDEYLGGSSDPKYDIVRRQTLKTAQRYTTTALQQFESNIMQAKEALYNEENAILLDIQNILSKKIETIKKWSDYVSWLDVYTSYAQYSFEHGFTKAIVRQDTSVIDIVGGRHPVIAEFLPAEQPFIPNNLCIGDRSHIHLITGPNMGGKSTFLRQNALIVLLAHCGLRVPAQSATIGQVDCIFARVGSGDLIAKNQSTFMTEMIEVAHILRSATDKSFIIFDELGRGTSTYDGLAITKAILHHIAQSLHARTLLATHYHELIHMGESIDVIDNYSVSVYENGEAIVFLKKIVPGGIDKSYGIHVAKLAGVPSNIIAHAQSLLKTIENSTDTGIDKKTESTMDHIAPSNDIVQNQSKHTIIYQKIKTVLESYNTDNMTPLQALQLIIKLKEDIKD